LLYSRFRRRARAHLERVERRGLVDVDVRLVELAHRVGEVRPLLVVQAPGAQLVLVDLGDRGKHAHRELARAHLHAEDGHRQAHARVQRHVLGDVEREGGLAHRGAPGDDDQVAGLQARGLLVELGEAGGHAGDVRRVVLVVEVVDALVDAREDRRDAEQPLVLARAGLGDLEDLRLGLVEQLVHVLAGRGEGGLGDLGGDVREAPLHRALADELRVAPDVERARGVLRERREVGRPARLVLVLARLDGFGDRDHVGRPSRLDEARDVPPDAPVVVAVEVLARHQVGDAVEGLVVEQQCAEQRLLRLHRVRRNPEREYRVRAFLSRYLLRERHSLLSSPEGMLCNPEKKGRNLPFRRDAIHSFMTNRYRIKP
jgi:hypothetical protein